VHLNHPCPIPHILVCHLRRCYLHQHQCNSTRILAHVTTYCLLEYEQHIFFLATHTFLLWQWRDVILLASSYSPSSQIWWWTGRITETLTGWPVLSSQHDGEAVVSVDPSNYQTGPDPLQFAVEWWPNWKNFKNEFVLAPSDLRFHCRNISQFSSNSAVQNPIPWRVCFDHVIRQLWRRARQNIVLILIDLWLITGNCRLRPSTLLFDHN